MLAQTPVAVPEMVPGVAVRVLIATVLLLLVAHALDAFTDRFPDTNVGATLTEIVDVPCPDKIVTPAGAAQGERSSSTLSAAIHSSYA